MRLDGFLPEPDVLCVSSAQHDVIRNRDLLHHARELRDGAPRLACFRRRMSPSRPARSEIVSRPLSGRLPRSSVTTKHPLASAESDAVPKPRKRSRPPSFAPVASSTAALTIRTRFVSTPPPQ